MLRLMHHGSFHVLSSKESELNHAQGGQQKELFLSIQTVRYLKRHSRSAHIFVSVNNHQDVLIIVKHDVECELK